MDITEIYVKMSDCEEIQKNWAPRTGDFIILHGTDDVGILNLPKDPLEGSLILYYDLSYEHHHIWLPRQDQLQEMVGGFNLLGFWQKFFVSSDYVVETEVGYELPKWAHHCDSWEQLWLSFVMKEKFNKIWSNGESWILLE